MSAGYGIRGFIDAYDAGNGERQMALLTLSLVREPGHETWKATRGKSERAGVDYGTRSRDNTTFWTTGNPSPSNPAQVRAGDNLYSNSLLALDRSRENSNGIFSFLSAMTMTMTPRRCLHGFDQGDRHLILQRSQRVFYLIDRSNGKLVFANPFARVTGAIRRTRAGSPCAKGRLAT